MTEITALIIAISSLILTMFGVIGFFWQIKVSGIRNFEKEVLINFSNNILKPSISQDRFIDVAKFYNSIVNVVNLFDFYTRSDNSLECLECAEFIQNMRSTLEDVRRRLLTRPDNSGNRWSRVQEVMPGCNKIREQLELLLKELKKEKTFWHFITKNKIKIVG